MSSKNKLALLALAVLLAVSIMGCAFIKEPKVSVVSATPSSVSLSSITLNVKIRIDNPNPFSAHLTKLEFDIYYLRGGKYIYLGHGKKKEVNIKANGITEIVVPVKIDNLQAISALLQLARNGKVSIKIKGNAYIDLKVTRFSVPFEQVEEIKLS